MCFDRSSKSPRYGQSRHIFTGFFAADTAENCCTGWVGTVWGVGPKFSLFPSFWRKFRRPYSLCAMANALQNTEWSRPCETATVTGISLESWFNTLVWWNLTGRWNAQNSNRETRSIGIKTGKIWTSSKKCHPFSGKSGLIVSNSYYLSHKCLLPPAVRILSFQLLPNPAKARTSWSFLKGAVKFARCVLRCDWCNWMTLVQIKYVENMFNTHSNLRVKTFVSAALFFYRKLIRKQK